MEDRFLGVEGLWRVLGGVWVGGEGLGWSMGEGVMGSEEERIVHFTRMVLLRGMVPVVLCNHIRSTTAKKLVLNSRGI